MARDDDHLNEGVRQILALRRAAEQAPPVLRSVIEEACEFIERELGPTIKAAQAARILGISQTALNRWLDRAEVGSVLTPEGRREVPLGELVDVLEDVEQEAASGSSRPLSAALKKRNEAAHATIDADRLVPPPAGHRRAELQSLAYHRVVADRLDETAVEHAKRRLLNWRKSGRIHPRWADEWERILALPIPRIARAITADTQKARDLRQSSPFTGMLNQQERHLIADVVNRRVRA